jgi:hypothetical protein
LEFEIQLFGELHQIIVETRQFSIFERKKNCLCLIMLKKVRKAFKSGKNEFIEKDIELELKKNQEKYKFYGGNLNFTKKYK